MATLFAGSVAHAAIDFKKEILPLLESHCLKCHRAAHEENGRMLKPKGDVRLDAAWSLLKGNGEIVPIKPKDAEHSDIVRVVSLPREDDLAMPPKDQGDPLTAAEIAKLKTWINEGANFGGWEGNLEGKPAGDAKIATAPAKEREHESFFAKLAAGLDQPAPAALEKARGAGAQIAPLQDGNPLLRADFLKGVSRCDDHAVAELTPISERIAVLDLARTNITDAALEHIARMPRLARLDLRKTKVTDAGVAQLAGLQNLTSINLFGCEVTDQALAALAKIKSLKEIYLFETKATEAGVSKLMAALPKARVVYQVDLSADPEKPKAAKKN
jgi:hypothetical protein